METYLSTLRSGIGSNGLVTTYNYKPLFGPSAITSENGYTTYYDYAEGYRYPVLEAKTVSYCGKELVEEIYYCSPEMQLELAFDEGNRTIRKRTAAEGHGSHSSDDQLGRKDNKTGLAYHLSRDEGSQTVTINYSSEQPVKVSVLLTNTQGYVYRRVEQTDGSAITLSYSGLPRSQYILHINADNEQFAEKFNVK